MIARGPCVRSGAACRCACDAFVPPDQQKLASDPRRSVRREVEDCAGNVIGGPIRPSGIVAATASSSPLVLRPYSKASVATGPGATVLTRMCGASSSASVSLRLFSAALAAAYGPVRGEPRVPAPELMLMMELPDHMRVAAALHP